VPPHTPPTRNSKLNDKLLFLASKAKDYAQSEEKCPKCRLMIWNRCARHFPLEHCGRDASQLIYHVLGDCFYIPQAPNREMLLLSEIQKVENEIQNFIL
jgi:hypothetical protein